MSIFSSNLAFLVYNFYHTSDPVLASNHCHDVFLFEVAFVFFFFKKEVLKPHVHAVESNSVKAAAKVVRVFFQSLGITVLCNTGVYLPWLSLLDVKH